MLSARCDWLTFAFCWSICFVPTCMPIARATITNASQPKTAVFQWPALQRPMRAARLFDLVKGDMASLSSPLRGLGGEPEGLAGERAPRDAAALLPEQVGLLCTAVAACCAGRGDR